MVAAWIRADTGVGPSMAWGSQVWRGNWADLAKAPTASRMQISVMSGLPVPNELAWAKIWGRLRVCRAWGKTAHFSLGGHAVTALRLTKIRKAAITSATSPMTWVIIALRAASTALSRSYQKPISR